MDFRIYLNIQELEYPELILKNKLISKKFIQIKKIIT